MADVFISYSRSNEALAQLLAVALAKGGHSVWWDRKLLAGSRFGAEIERELEMASAVVVIWSRESVKSNWVCNEADIAGKRGVLIPIRADNTEPPLPHRLLHTLDFSDWSGESECHSIQELDRAIQQQRLNSRRAFESAVTARIQGLSRSGGGLAAIVEAGGEWSQHALVELCYYEFARLGDQRAISAIRSLVAHARTKQALYICNLLVALCRLAGGEVPAKIDELTLIAPTPELRADECVRFALQEILVFGALDEAARIESAWNTLMAAGANRAPESFAYPSIAEIRAYDRAVLSVLYGNQDIGEICRLLPSNCRGLVHQAASNCHAARKSTPTLTEIVQRARQGKWQRQPSETDLRRRLRKFERAVLPSAGTLFPPLLK